MNIKIKLVDLKRQYLSIKKEIDKAIQNVLNDSAFSGGKYVEEFEKHFAKYIGTKYAVAVNNGTSALHLAMLVLGVGKGDEVIIPANTFIATAWAVSYVGATPVFVDCDPKTWQIDPKKVEKAITKKTKVIIGVHLYGQSFNVDSIKKIAKKYKLFLVEDCAQAHGALYKNKMVGNFGDLTCFSFYPSKNLGSYGEGGAVVTNNHSYAKRLQLLKNQGSLKKYHHDEIGYNMRMEGFQGAILDVKLKHLDRWNKRKQRVADMYFKGIKNPSVVSQYQPEWTKSVYYLYVITIKNRDKFMKFLLKNDIETGIHYPIPCHLQKAYKFLGYKKGDFPTSEHLANHCVSLPIYPELIDFEIKKIINVVNAYKN